MWAAYLTFLAPVRNILLKHVPAGTCLAAGRVMCEMICCVSGRTMNPQSVSTIRFCSSVMVSVSSQSLTGHGGVCPGTRSHRCRWWAVPLSGNDQLGDLADDQRGWKWPVTTMFSCPGLPASQSGWWKTHSSWYYVSVKDCHGNSIMPTLPAAPLFSPKSSKKKKKRSQNICILWCCRIFYSSFSLQIYDLFEGNSESLWLFISPKAPPALRSLIRWILCLAHSDKVNYSTAFKSLTLSYLKSITHWVDKLVK